MHDPMTLAIDIKRPWPTLRSYMKYRKNGKQGWLSYPSLIEIWHVDPESDGSDDSCDWFGTKKCLSQKDIEWAKRIASSRFTVDEIMTLCYDGDRFGLSVHLYNDVKRYFENRYPYGKLTHKEIRMLMGHAYNIVRDRSLELPLDRGVEFVNDQGETESSVGDEMQERVKGMYMAMMRFYKQYHRPWYKHPRYHVHHWRIKIPFIQDFKRWVFGRCCKCGKRFSYGYAPISDNWNGTGPLWFKSETGIYHHHCDRESYVAMHEHGENQSSVMGSEMGRSSTPVHNDTTGGQSSGNEAGLDDI